MRKKRLTPDRTELEQNRAILRRSVDEVWETTAKHHPKQEVSVTLPGLPLDLPGAWNFFNQDALAISFVKHVERVETPWGAGWKVTFWPYASATPGVSHG